MKTQSQFRSRGFTLIEMLAVITIIVILAGLVVGSLGYVKDKQARETARVQIELLANGLEQYKLDNGAFPVGANAKPGDSNILYRALYWDSDEDGQSVETDTDQKIYVTELDPKNNKQKWIDGQGAGARILDPWGKEFYFRSGKLDNGSPNPDARNPDFDLWSAGPDGKTSTGGDDTDVTKDDIKVQ